MPVQDIEQASGTTQESSGPPPSKQLQRGQHVSGDVWNTVFRDRPEDRLANFLGWFSIGLGAAELFFPRKLGRLIGARGHSGVTRVMGLREIAAGVGILGNPGNAGWMKARVAGDVIDLALLGTALTERRAERGRLAGAIGAVAGVMALDILSSKQLSRDRNSARARYSGDDTIRIEKSIAINRSPEDCYRFWRDFDNLPRFMEHLDAVYATGETRSHWKAKTLGGTPVEWDAVITNDTPGKSISWKSLDRADVANSGTVWFEPGLSGPGAMVRVSMDFHAPGGKLGAAAVRLFGNIPEHQVHQDLRRFKAVMETGEFPTTEGQPSGRKEGKD